MILEKLRYVLFKLTLHGLISIIEEIREMLSHLFEDQFHTKFLYNWAINVIVDQILFRISLIDLNLVIYKI